MDIARFTRPSASEWQIPATGRMRVPAILYGDEDLIRGLDDKVAEQAMNVATLPGIVKASYAMPDAHWGYGFPIGGVAAFDEAEGGVISAGGVGFDISCGVRALYTGLKTHDLEGRREALATALYHAIPAGLGSTGHIHLNARQMDEMLAGGAQWAVAQGYGNEADLERVEERGRMPGADPAKVSQHARKRQQDEMGTLGSGNHYLEVQRVAEIFDEDIAHRYGIQEDDVLISIHCGSRGLGHQIGMEFLKRMVLAAPGFGIELPDRELACAPIRSDLGRDYLGAMRAAINCALANRQIITHLARQAAQEVIPGITLPLFYDVSHNTCKEETHIVDGRERRLFVHRKGATRALGPGHEALPAAFREVGQPVLVGGSMGTSSHILAGTRESAHHAFSSACHGAGRAMSRSAAKKRWRGRDIVEELGRRGIVIRGHSLRGIAEEAPLAYKDVDQVVDSTDHAGLARKVARLEPLICIKG